MKLLWLGRQMGKTTEAVKYCVKHDKYLAVHSAAEASRIFHQFKDEFPTFRYPVLYSELPLKGAHPNVRSVVVDNLDLFLANRFQIEAATITAENMRNEGV